MMTILLSLALAAAPGNAAGPASTDGAAGAQAAKPAKPKKVCEKVEVSGSNVPKRVCRIVREPKVETEAADAAPEKTESRGTN